MFANKGYCVHCSNPKRAYMIGNSRAPVHPMKLLHIHLEAPLTTYDPTWIDLRLKIIAGSSKKALFGWDAYYEMQSVSTRNTKYIHESKPEPRHISKTPARKWGYKASNPMQNSTMYHFNSTERNTPNKSHQGEGTATKWNIYKDRSRHRATYTRVNDRTINDARIADRIPHHSHFRLSTSRLTIKWDDRAEGGTTSNAIQD